VRIFRLQSPTGIAYIEWNLQTESTYRDRVPRLSTPFLVQYFLELPTLQPPDDPDLWAAKMHDSMRRFSKQVQAKYSEGTLLRLLAADDVECRRGAVLALGLLGTMAANGPLAARLRDDDSIVARMAGEALWQLWFRGGSEEDNAELLRVIHLPDFLEILAGLDDLIRTAPEFAEAYNQRAILFFRRGEYNRSAADCEKVLSRNPHHFGAQAGLGQCLLKLHKPRAAARAFRLALQINPTLKHLEETIEQLEAE
jgi:tetratricopeptide (TPR) repeat protein